MEILICGIPGSGNSLLQDTIAGLLGKAGSDRNGIDGYEKSDCDSTLDRFWELDQRVYLFVRRFLRRRNIHSPFLHRGGYQFKEGIPVLRSRHRLSLTDFLFIRATLDHDPKERVLTTRSMPGDLPDVAKLFCTKRDPEALINAGLNRIDLDMKHYVDLDQITTKDIFLSRWSDIQRFDRIVERICSFYRSYLEHGDRLCTVSYDEWFEDPLALLKRIRDALGVDVGEETLGSMCDAICAELTGEADHPHQNGKTRTEDSRIGEFQIRNFMTPDHLAVIEKHGWNELMVDLGFDSRSSFTSSDISVRNIDSIRMELPEHLTFLDAMEERKDNNEVTIGNVNIRFRGATLRSPDMARLARELQDYLSNYREDLEGRSVLLYGSGSLGELVKDRLENANCGSIDQTRIAGVLEGDDLSISDETKYDAVILCSIQHESAMEEKLMSARALPGDKVLAWYDII